MDQTAVKELIEKISKTSNKDNIYRALVKLKTNFVTDKHGIQVFYENNGIPPLVRLITKPYERIIDISLSILGNCCTIKCCCEQALESGVVSPLLTILRSIKNEGIQSRACRLLGNLARECTGKLGTSTKGFGTVLSSAISSSTNVLTLTCAIRAVRMLWVEKIFYEEFGIHEGTLYIRELLLKYSKSRNVIPMNTDTFGKQEKKSTITTSTSPSTSLSFTSHRSDTLNLPTSDIQSHVDHRNGIENEFKIPTNVQELNLIGELFRCFQVMINIKSNPLIHFLNHELAYCIILYAQHNSPFRTIALKLLTYFSSNKFGSLKYIIQNANAVSIIVDVLCKIDIDPPKTEPELIYCIEIITNLSSDSCNRAKIRDSNTFKSLLEIAKSTTSDRVLLMILVCLQAFRYDNMSMDQLVRMGLINLLITELNVRTADITENHKISKNSMKRCIIEKEVITENIKRLKNDVKTNLPSSLKSASPCSPTTSLSPHFSPFRANDTSVEDFDYSPVCSDIEDSTDKDDDPMNDDKINPNDVADCDNDAMDNNDNDDDVNDIDNGELNISSEYGIKNIETKEIDTQTERLSSQDEDEEQLMALPPLALKITQCLVDLLGNAARRIGNQHCISLCQEHSLLALIKTCRLMRTTPNDDYADYKRGAPYVLYSIISCAKNFTTLLQKNFIFHVFSLTQPMHDPKDCETCDNLKHLGKYLMNELCAMAETGYGVGEMAHLLIKEDKQMQNQVACIAPLIIKKHLYLHNLLIYHKGIHTILNIILTPDEILATEAANSLTVLSSKLNLKCIQELKNITLFKYSLTFSEFDLLYDKSNTNQNDLITFVVGTGTNDDDDDDVDDNDNVDGQVEETSEEKHNNNHHIQFDGEILKKNSEFFDVMLSSNFRESNEKRIYLKNQTIVGVKYFLNSIVQFANKKRLNKPLETNINCILEAYDLCQIYMLKELETEMYNMIVFSMTPKTILNIFEFSMVKQKMELIEIAINYYLSANLESREQKVQIFRQVNESKFGKDWYEMIVNKYSDSFIKYDS